MNSVPGADAYADLFPTIAADLAEVEARLRRVVHSRLPVVPEVYLHTVHAGGKRVRPALALLAGRLAGEACEATYDVAVVVELIHLASLIHDDVVDDSSQRRARLTANRVWGNKNAVLVADFTHAVAYRLLTRRCSVEVIDRVTSVVIGMVEGELTQMYNEGSLDVAEQLYFEMIGHKTAGLMELAAELGAQVSGGAAWALAALREYGRCIGLAFQVVDDLLDIAGDEARLGKPVGSDVRCGRLTLPLIRVLHAGAPDAADELRALVTRTTIDLDTVKAIRDVVERAGGLDHARETAERLADQATAALAPFPDSEARRALAAFAGYIVARSQ